MKKENESIIVLISIVYAIILYSVVLLKGNRPSLTFKGVYFDKHSFPVFFKFLLITSIFSLVIGLLVTKDVILACEFLGLNLFISAVMGLNFLLYRRKKDKN